MLPLVSELFSDMTPAAFSVRQYCCSCVAHRLVKVGWEPQINYYDARNLILLGMYLPPHSRVRILNEAWAKAEGQTDPINLRVMAMLRGVLQDQGEQKASA